MKQSFIFTRVNIFEKVSNVLDSLAIESSAPFSKRIVCYFALPTINNSSFKLPFICFDDLILVKLQGRFVLRSSFIIVYFYYTF
jgi:hypothetical protein